MFSIYNPVFEKFNKKRPILSFQDIDNIVFNVISDFDKNSLVIPKPFNIDVFIESYLKCTIDYQDLSNNGCYLGMILFNDSNNVIVYDKQQNSAKYISAKKGTIIIDNSIVSDEKRYNFTCAHECGHWMIHRTFFEHNDNQISLFDDELSIIKCRTTCNDYTINKGNNDDFWIEWQADKFAAALLMPTKAVYNLLDKSKCNSEYMIDKLSDVFNVSKQAANYRLCDLKFIVDSNQIKL